MPPGGLQYRGLLCSEQLLVQTHGWNCNVQTRQDGISHNLGASSKVIKGEVIICKMDLQHGR